MNSLWLNCVLTCLICVIVDSTANPSVAGTDFVIPAFFSSYGEDVEYDDTPKLYISGLHSSASINLTGTARDEVLTFSVGEGCTIPVLLNCRLSAKELGVQNSAMRVQSDQPIVVRMHQEHLNPNMPTSYLTFPKSLLGTDYFVVDAGPSGAPSELMITAVEGSTQVSITPSARVQFRGGVSHDAGDDFQVTLQMFETLILRSDGDLTGTTVTSSNPVVVTIGDHCTPSTPENTICRQPHQLLSTDQWGDRFVVTSFISSEDSKFQIFAKTDETTVRLIGDGSSVSSVLNRGESSIENARSGNVYVIEADQPVYVVQYDRDSQAMTPVPAEVHRMSGDSPIPVIAKSSRNAVSHVLITTRCADRDGFQIDSEPLPRSSAVLTSSDGDDCVVRVPLSGGNHWIKHESPEVTYLATIQVTDDAMSMAYPASLSTADEMIGPGELEVSVVKSTAVRSFMARPRPDGSVRLSWRPPESWNGKPKGYRIQVKQASDPGFCHCRNVLIYNPRRTRYMLRNLYPGTRYVIGVRPMGSSGDGDRVDTVVSTSRDSGLSIQ